MDTSIRFNTKTRKSLVVAVTATLALGLGLHQVAHAADVQATVPYQVSVFAQSTSTYSQPDSIAVAPGRVFIAYGNGNLPDGSDGKSSTIVEYSTKGKVLTTFSVVGHNDGLKINPKSGDLWAMQNEDANPNLVIINPHTGAQRVFTFGPTPHGGGYDDMVFRNGKVFVSASNPANNPNTGPAIVQLVFNGDEVNVVPVLMGDATAIDIQTGSSIGLNLQDPDSMTLAPTGDIVLDSQDDAELLIVHHPGHPSQKVGRVSLMTSGGPVKVDDTVFATATQGMLLVSDTGGNTVYAAKKPFFAPEEVFSAANDSGEVGKLDLGTGIYMPILSGLTSPHGMAFIPAWELVKPTDHTEEVQR